MKDFRINNLQYKYTNQNFQINAIIEKKKSKKKQIIKYRKDKLGKTKNEKKNYIKSLGILQGNITQV